MSNKIKTDVNANESWENSVSASKRGISPAQMAALHQPEKPNPSAQQSPQKPLRFTARGH